LAFAIQFDNLILSGVVSLLSLKLCIWMLRALQSHRMMQTHILVKGGDLEKTFCANVFAGKH